jgi:hypothetical protein
MKKILFFIVALFLFLLSEHLGTEKHKTGIQQRRQIKDRTIYRHTFGFTQLCKTIATIKYVLEKNRIWRY